MATGTGNLPNQGMAFTPFDPLPAEDLNDIVENIESLADGTGLGDGAVKSENIDFTTFFIEVDSNGWSVYRRVDGKKEYRKSGATSSISFPAETWAIHTLTSAPTGVSVDNTFVTGSAATGDAAVNVVIYPVGTTAVLAQTYNAYGGVVNQAIKYSLVLIEK